VENNSNQLPLFPVARLTPNPEAISILDAATELNVSSATIRNWIKTNYLEINDHNAIMSSSLTDFKENVAGKFKLIGRANKSFADRHDHCALTRIISRMLLEKSMRGSEISQYYENNLSISYKNSHGIYYTPAPICDLMFSQIPSNRKNLIFLDPCCGSGSFLLAAIRAGFPPENVHGCDSDDTAIAIAKQRIFELTGHISTTLFQGDYLDPSNIIHSMLPKVDVIFTNPPWGGKMNKVEKGRLAQRYHCNSSLDLSGIFLLASRRRLVEGGYYGMVLPQSFFNVSAFRSARSILLEDQLLTITDHGRIFPNLLTKAVSVVAARKLRTSATNITCVNSDSTVQREQSSFKTNPDEILNYWATSSDMFVIKRIFEWPHVTLAKRAKWALGVVTGNNKLHLKKTMADGFVPVYKGADIGKNSLKSPTNYISSDMSKFQQVAPKALYEAPEKIIYRFISSQIICYYDTEKLMVLNSANIFVPNDEFPIGKQLLADYLNSKFINWIFEKMFSTSKILRSDLEKIPILVEQLAGMERFDESIFLERAGIERLEDGSYRVKE
jgi:site-specific DNA-methyltransferase (adenine-specific)